MFWASTLFHIFEIISKNWYKTKISAYIWFIYKNWNLFKWVSKALFRTFLTKSLSIGFLLEERVVSVRLLRVVVWPHCKLNQEERHWLSRLIQLTTLVIASIKKSQKIQLPSMAFKIYTQWYNKFVISGNLTKSRCPIHERIRYFQFLSRWRHPNLIKRNLKLSSRHRWGHVLLTAYQVFFHLS